MTYALAVCITVVVSLFTKQVALCLLVRDVTLLLFSSELVLLGLECCDFWVMQYDDFLLLYTESILF